MDASSLILPPLPTRAELVQSRLAGATGYYRRGPELRVRTTQPSSIKRRTVGVSAPLLLELASTGCGSAFMPCLERQPQERAQREPDPPAAVDAVTFGESRLLPRRIVRSENLSGFYGAARGVRTLDMVE